MTQKFNSESKKILICQGHTCSLSHSAQVLATFQVNCPSEVEIIGCGCLGQCGNGPMVLFLPEKTWYSGVSCETAIMIIEQHINRGEPVVKMLYSKFHTLPSYKQKKVANSFFGWLIALIVILAFVLTVVWVLASNQTY